MDKEVEEFANELYREYFDVELEMEDGIEFAFYLQMAGNLIKKGYRRTATKEPEWPEKDKSGDGLAFHWNLCLAECIDAYQKSKETT